MSTEEFNSCGGSTAEITNFSYPNTGLRDCSRRNAGLGDKQSPPRQQTQPPTDDDLKCGACKLCGRVDRRMYLIQCDRCHHRFHAVCVELRPVEARALPSWTCATCVPVAQDQGDSCQPQHQSGPILAARNNRGGSRQVEDLTAFSALWKTGGRVLQRIPKGSRPLAAETLTTTINGLLDSQLRSQEHWLRLLFFARCCLCAPRRGKKTS